MSRVLSGIFVPTMYAGLVDAAHFDAVEIEDMIEDGAFELVPAMDNPDETPCAVSVRLHYSRGGVETVQDFYYDPTEPGAREIAVAEADALAASLGSIIIHLDPDTNPEFVLKGGAYQLYKEATK